MLLLRQVFFHFKMPKNLNVLQDRFRIFGLARGYKFFLLNSAEHENFPAHNVKMLTVVGILTFMSRKIAF